MMQMRRGVNYKITPIDTPIDTSNSYYYSGKYLYSDDGKNMYSTK
jgi:hypothetical protein